MYPLLARRSHLAAYLLLWLLMGALLSALLTTQGGLAWTLALLTGVPSAIAYSFICLSAWYVARAMPLARTGSARVIVSALAAAALSSAMWLVFARGWTALVVSRWAAQSGPTFAAIQSMLFGIGVLLYLLSLAVSYVLVVYETSQDAQRRGLQGQVLAREAELRSLRAQIDPHFLFNSLNSISALTTADPPGRGACACCSASSCVRRWRSAARIASRCRASWPCWIAFLPSSACASAIGCARNCAPAMPGAASCRRCCCSRIVENAVTHGIAHLIEGGTIRVSADRNGPWLRIVVENPCDPDRPRRRGAGVGLANVRARLRAMHGADAGLTAGEAHEVWRVELTLPAAIGEAS